MYSLLLDYPCSNNLWTRVLVISSWYSKLFSGLIAWLRAISIAVSASFKSGPSITIKGAVPNPPIAILVLPEGHLPIATQTIGLSAGVRDTLSYMSLTCIVIDTLVINLLFAHLLRMGSQFPRLIISSLGAHLK